MQNIEPFRRAHISTGDFPEGNRLAMWSEIYGRGSAKVDIQPSGDETINGEGAVNRLPKVSSAAGAR